MSSNGEKEKLRLEYIPLSQVVLWDENPKRHDVEGIIQSIIDNGYTDPAKYDLNLNKGIGGLVFGNGRSKCVMIMKERGLPAPRAVIEDENGEWFLPVLFGIDAASEAAAKRFAIDHNNLTMAGGDYNFVDIAKMYDVEGYANVLTELCNINIVPVTISQNDIIALLKIFEKQQVEFKEYDETIADDIEVCKCEKCGHEHAAKKSG